MASSGEMSAQAMYDGFWPKVMDEVQNLDANSFKQQELPLARIKKVKPLKKTLKTPFSIGFPPTRS